MANSTATVEVKLSDDLKTLCDLLPENMSERLAEIERVLIEICDREGIAFSGGQANQPSRERVMRNVSAK